MQVMQVNDAGDAGDAVKDASKNLCKPRHY
jgi:hypothetical protein